MNLKNNYLIDNYDTFFNTNIYYFLDFKIIKLNYLVVREIKLEIKNMYTNITLYFIAILSLR